MGRVRSFRPVDWEHAINGYHTAVQMPVHFFDYTTRWEGDTMVNQLVGYGEMGGVRLPYPTSLRP